MSYLLRSVLAYCHTVPLSRMAPCLIGEGERANQALAGLRIRELLRAHEPRQRRADREEQHFRNVWWRSLWDRCIVELLGRRVRRKQAAIRAL